MDNDEIIAMTASGVVIRIPVSEFRIIGRGTKGVRVMRLDENDKVVGIAIVPAEMVNGDEPVAEENNGAE
jgi:DNA gyrase subunit A